jgi:ornithine cyclodeaminase/alanine dehydrogenase-like protein (mu-crystallin family)
MGLAVAFPLSAERRGGQGVRKAVNVKIIDEQEVRSAVGPAEALEAAERAFRALGEGTAVQPPPLGLDVPPVAGEVHVKGAYLAGSPIFALKIATGFYQNASRGLPSGAGLFLVFDATTGFPLALLRENGYLTDLRTGAAGALAARYLAPERIRTVAVLGSGVASRSCGRSTRCGRGVPRASTWSATARKWSASWRCRCTRPRTRSGPYAARIW